MNTEPTFESDPSKALDLVEILVSGDTDKLKSAANSAFKEGRLHDLDLACLVLIHVGINRTTNIGHLYRHSDETWRKVFDIAARGRSEIAKKFEVNSTWLGEDVVGFMQNCVLPAISGKAPRIAVPQEAGEGQGTPFDEVVIHVTASAFCAFAVLQGIASTSPAFGNLGALVDDLKVYLSDIDHSDGEVEIMSEEEIRAERLEDGVGRRVLRREPSARF